MLNMVWFKRVFVILFVVISLLLALAFMTANETKVAVDFFAWQASATIGVWMLLAFLVGLIVTLLASYPLIAAYRFRLYRAQRKQLGVSASEKVALPSTL